MGISLANMLGPISYRLKCLACPLNGEGATRAVVVNKERERRCGSTDVTEVMVGINVTQISDAHKTVNSKPKNILLGSLESL